MAITNDPNAPIRFSDIREEFGGTAPDYLNEYYRGGANVPNDLDDAVIGVTEVQTITPSGTRSNVVGEGDGINEQLLIALANDFDPGESQQEIILSTTGTFGSITQSFGDDYAFPNASTPGFTVNGVASTDWQFAVGSDEASTGGSVLPSNVGFDFDFIGSGNNPVTSRYTRIEIDITVTAFPPDNEWDPTLAWNIRGTSSAAGNVGDLLTDTSPNGTLVYFTGSAASDGAEITDIRGGFTDSGLLSGESITYEVTAVRVIIPDIPRTTFSFNPDVNNLVHTNSSSEIEIDFTNALWDKSDTNVNGYIGGNWRTISSNVYSFNGRTATLSTVVDEFFSEMTFNLQPNVTVTRNGNVITIVRTDGDMTFWVGTGSTSENFSDFVILSGQYGGFNWHTPPVIRVGVNGGAVTEYDYSSQEQLRTSPTIRRQEFAAGTDTDTSITQIGTAIEDLATSITWDGSISDHSVTAVPSSITIDYTSAVFDGTFYFEYAFGNWSSNSEGTGELLGLFGTAIPTSPVTIVDEIETEINSKLAAGFTLTRTGDVLVLAADSGDVTLRIDDNSSTSNTTFDFDSSFTTQPIVRVLTPTIGTAAQDGDTELVGNSIEIDYSNIVISGDYSEYFFGNWNTNAPNGERVRVDEVDSPLTVLEIVDRVQTEINSKLETGFTLDRDGLVLTLSSPSRLTFAFNSNSNDSTTFDFDSDWTTIPVITQVTPTAGQIYVENDARVDIGTDIFTGRSITIDLGTDQNIDAALTVIQNNGMNTDPILVATHGVPGAGINNVRSTYTVTDYAGNEITSFPSSVALANESDLSLVKDMAISAINSNMETPVDFTATNGAGNIVITATEEAAVSGVWTVTANHHGVAAEAIGDISFGPASVIDGATPSPATLINQNVPTSGPITTDDFRGAYDPDNPVNS